MNSLKLLCLFFLLFVLSSHAQQSASDDELVKSLDHYLSAKFQANEPGASVLVIKDGKTLLRRGYGLSNVESKTANTPETIFRIGSVTKQFTSAAILKMVEKGNIGLQDDIRKYLPDYPVQGKKITIEHLLTHTSGIKSYTGIPEAMTTEAKAKPTKVDEMINVFKDKPFDFNPGDAYRYNNSGYFLLGAIVEKVSGMKWGEYLKKNFFDPLQMKSTYYYDPKLPTEATGYNKTSGAEFSVADYVHPSIPFSAGAIFSTVDDLWKWEQAIVSYKVVRKDLLEKAWTPLTLNNGKKESYGYGWGLGRVGDQKVIGHGGGIDGFLCHELYLPDSKIFVAVLLNSNAVSPDAIAYDLAYKVSNLPVPTVITLAEKDLDEYTGVYQVSEKETQIILSRANGQLYCQRAGGPRQEIYPFEKDGFIVKDSPSRLKFNRSADGKITEVEWMGREYFSQHALKTDKPVPRERVVIELEASVFDNYTGEYELAPGFVITVRRDGNRFIAQATGQPAFEIFPESETRFFLKVIDAQIEFRKSSDGKVESLVLFQGGRETSGRKIK